MVDKKLTDSEIKKALECKKEEIICAVADENKATHFVYNEDALDLINRQKEEKEALINGQETLQKYIAEQTAEIERLEHQLETLCLTLKLAKAEAYKEFAERLIEKYGYYDWENKTIVYPEDEINNLLKELVGEDNG